ncbi:MAG: hypothetical protein WD157_01570 [Patescibacteria group bacterium]
MSDDEKLFVCESCGQTTPVDNDTCTNCGGKMIVLDDNVEPNPENLKDDELDSSVGVDDAGAGTQSLEALASKEHEENDEDYRHDSFDDEA